MSNGEFAALGRRLLIVTAVAFFAVHASPQDARAQRLIVSVADLAEQLLPSVVNIAVETIVPVEAAPKWVCGPAI